MADEHSTDERKAVPVCGIGASAGGVHALTELFGVLPVDLGLAYVVVMHLSDDHPSMLDEILAKATEMPVHQVTGTTAIEPDSVYVITPYNELTIKNGLLSVRPHQAERYKRAPIDLFFESIAAVGRDGFAMVLSGAGSDGAAGVRAVKASGGLVFVQDPGEAEFTSMPQSAIATGGADFIAPIAELVELLAEASHNRHVIEQIDETEAADDLAHVISLLGGQTGHDFSSFKRATVMRRVRRRMHVCGVTTLPAYARHLKAHLEEAQNLLADLLISVTQFFRDSDSFAALNTQVIEPLITDPPEDGVRVWVVGCATGEEVYSLAILLLECAERHEVGVQFQIFATDLDEAALKVAREGRYPKSIEADVSPDRLKRFFTRDDGFYKIRKEVREVVMFAAHSVLKDPPFVRLDLVSCRNLMIYMERTLQEKLCALFHYCLKPAGKLFLGSAETADCAPELFATSDRDARIYRARPKTDNALPDLPQVDHAMAGTPRPAKGPKRERREPQPAGTLHMRALEAAAPPSILIDEHRSIVHLSPEAGRFLLHSGGPFSGRIGDVVRPELRLDLQYAVERAFTTGAPTLTVPLPVAFNGHHNRIALHVTKVDHADHGPQALIVFLDGGVIELDPDEDEHDLETKPDEVRRLHAELRAATEALVASRTKHESAIQDLRAANEELQSMNEEYRSTSEELETSKEELQSMNEELQTVNAELKIKLKSISSAHNDLRNLTAATEIGTLFLDSKMHIRMFTPPVAELFSIEDTDVGRPLTDFTNQLDYDGLEEDVREVLRHLTPVEAELHTRDGRWLMMRVRPYRTMDDRIEGAVITLVDITRRREMETRVEESEARYRSLYNAMDQGYCLIELIRDQAGAVVDYTYLDTNEALERQTAQTDMVGKRNSDLLPDLGAEWYAFFDGVSRARSRERAEGEVPPLGRVYEVFATPHGEPGEDRLAVLFNDTTERKADEEQRELLTHELAHRVKNTLAVVQSMATMTGRGLTSVEDYKKRFVGRLQALGFAHTLLLQNQWRYAELSEIADNALAPYGGAATDRVTIKGEKIALTPKQGLSLAMILHELATNAAKYGALSTEDGRLHMSWKRTGDGEASRLTFTWTERGGPAAKAPEAPGFGSVLIERVCTHDLNGALSLDYGKTGLTAKVDFPLLTPTRPPQADD